MRIADPFPASRTESGAWLHRDSCLSNGGSCANTDGHFSPSTNQNVDPYAASHWNAHRNSNIDSDGYLYTAYFHQAFRTL
jgi:hypothetical protein